MFSLLIKKVTLSTTNSPYTYCSKIRIAFFSLLFLYLYQYCVFLIALTLFFTKYKEDECFILVDIKWFIILKPHTRAYLYILLVFLIYFNWRLITLQYCSCFCHTLTRISHGCTCVSPSWMPPHLPPHPIPQVHPSAPALSTISCIEPGLGICFTYDNVHVSMLVSQIIPSSPSPTESKRLFFTSVLSFAVLHVGLSLPFF